MATLTIRNLDEDVKQALREQAAKRGLSMESYVRGLLKVRSAEGEHKATLSKPLRNMWAVMEALRARHGAGDLPVPERAGIADAPPPLE